MQEILTESTVSVSIVYTLYNVIKLFKVGKKNSYDYSSTFCNKFDSS